MSHMSRSTKRSASHADEKEPEDEDMDWCEEARKDGRGWNIALFVKKERASQKLCGQCKNVCFDAVELVCSDQNDEDDDTDDEHETDYCKDCLARYLEANSNQCPVCSQPNATMRDVPYIRNKIGRLKIFCPRSNLLSKDNNQATLCEWQGTIAKLKAHLLNDCKFGLKKCIYFELGCKTKYIENTQDAKSHQSDCMMQHMEMLLRCITQGNHSVNAPINDPKIASNTAHNLENKLQAITSELKREIMGIKQHLQNQSNDANDTEDMVDVANEIEIDPQKVIGRCNKCGEDIKYFENELFNVTLTEKQWQHIDCEYQPQVVGADDTDQWSDRIKSHVIIIDKSRATLCGNTASQNHNFFGVITVKLGDDVKEWKVRINRLAQTGAAWVGIIDRYKMHQSLIGGAVYKCGISLNSNGMVYCFEKDSFQSSKPFKQGDIVTIILDISNNILLFKVNGDCIMVPVTNLSINLRNTEWNVFGSLYNEGDEMMILGDDDVYNFDDIKQDVDDPQDTELGLLGYSCHVCKETIHSRDFDLNNTEWSFNNDAWKHVDCKLSLYKLPDLSDSNKNADQFNRLLAAKAKLLLADDYTFTTKSNVYQTAFGVMNISKGTKIWNIRIEHGTGNMYIGIIETDKIKQVARNSIPSNGAYHITNNGTISGTKVNNPSPVSFKAGDAITIILDMDKGTLVFGNSNKQYAVASGANIKDKSFNLFVTMYSINDSVSIAHDYKDEGVELKEDKGKQLDTCIQCNKGLYESHFDENNVQWNDENGKWQHKSCNMDQLLQSVVPKLKLQDRDAWHPLFTNSGIQICNKRTAIGGNTTYYNSFGVITVSRGLKKWNIRINFSQKSFRCCGFSEKKLTISRHLVDWLRIGCVRKLLKLF